MTDTSTTFWTAIVGSNALSSGLASYLTARRGGKKDAGSLANDILEQTLARIAKLETENAECAKRLPIVERKLERTDIVLNLVTVDLHARAPDSPAIAQARAILGDAFPFDTHMPADMLAKLGKIE